MCLTYNHIGDDFPKQTPVQKGTVFAMSDATQGGIIKVAKDVCLSESKW